MNGCPNCATLKVERDAARAERDGWRNGFDACVAFESRLLGLPARDRPTAGGLFSDIADVYNRSLSWCRDDSDGVWHPIKLTIRKPE